MLSSLLLETPSYNNSIKDKAYLIPEKDKKPKRDRSEWRCGR